MPSTEKEFNGPLFSKEIFWWTDNQGIEDFIKNIYICFLSFLDYLP